MRSRIPSHIRWTGHKKMEELLDDPLAESLYGLFLKVKDSPRHITIKPEIILVTRSQARCDVKVHV